MDLLEGLLYMIWRGVAIGVIISAPMGPVGILCVQRTLEKGRRTGLYTGVGAAVSDLCYCLITAFGLSFVENFLERNSNIIQLVGSMVLIAFGVYLFKSNPSRKLKKPVGNHVAAGKNILNGFLFTVSNPLIIFLIIGLFARFNLMLPENTFYQYMAGFVSIFAGALLWWYVITFFVDKVRAHFNLRSMWLVNKIIGGIIFLFAIVGIVTAASGIMNAAANTPLYLNSSRGFAEFAGNSTDSVCKLENSTDKILYRMLPADSVGDFMLEFRLINKHNKPRKSYSYTDEYGKISKISFPGWGIVMKSDKGEDACIEFKTCDNITDETYTAPVIKVTMVENGIQVCEKEITEGMDLYDGENTFRLTKVDDNLVLKAGNREYKEVFAAKVRMQNIEKVGYKVEPGGEIELDNIVLIPSDRNRGKSMDKADIANLYDYLRVSSNQVEGLWMIYDRTLEDNYLRVGGDYRLAIKKSPEGYMMIYLSGAKVNSSIWEEGMIKGALISTPFEGVFDVRWFDSEGRAIPMEIKAQYDEGLIKMLFPTLNSELRLRRIPIQ